MSRDTRGVNSVPRPFHYVSFGNINSRVSDIHDTAMEFSPSNGINWNIIPEGCLENVGWISFGDKQPPFHPRALNCSRNTLKINWYSITLIEIMSSPCNVSEREVSEWRGVFSTGLMLVSRSNWIWSRRSTVMRFANPCEKISIW